MYALETFTQLLDIGAGALLHSNVTVADSPEYQWRGLMIDSGAPLNTLLVKGRRAVVKRRKDGERQ